MRLSKFSQSLEGAVRDAQSLQESLAVLCAFAGGVFGCDHVHIAYQHAGALLHSNWGGEDQAEDSAGLFYMRDGAVCFDGAALSLPMFISDLKRVSPRNRLMEALSRTGVRSYAVVPISFTGGITGWVECGHKHDGHLWRREDQTLLTVFSARMPLLLRDKTFLQDFPGTQSVRVAQPSTPGEVYYEKLSQIQREYRRLLEYGNFVLFKTNPDFAITDVRGDTERMLGIKPSEVLEDVDIWTRFLSTKARLLFSQKIRDAKRKRAELHDEFKIVHVKSREERWILFHGVPLFSPQNELMGWEALGLDISDKKSVEEALIQEKKRLQALYEVSHAAQFSAEPEIIALKTLRALKHATRSSVGFVVLLNPATKRFELVAAEGFSEEEVRGLERFANTSRLIRNVSELRNGTIARELHKKWRTGKGQIQLREGLVMPLVSDGLTGGVCFLARRSAWSYTHDDFSMIQIACSQIAARIKQAQYHIDEKKAADSLGVLYRLSHELSKYLTPREVAEHAVRIISEELPCRRLWLGVMNEQHTHVAGQAGFGPGMRQQIVQLQLELDQRHQFFDEAIESRKPVIVSPGQKMDCSGLEKLIQKLALQGFVIVPLVSLGQVFGVLLVEPENYTVFFGEGRLPLLMNIASEIGTVLLARRFEARVADTEKMKMAGLLASGVSHNFNNLLQAVMGHASLIQMQAVSGSQVEDSARRIIEAAGKGASVVSQLMTVSSRNIFSRKSMSVNKMFQESRDFYKSVLGPEISLEMDLEGETPNVLADYSQIQQAMTNVLLNAKESLEGRRDGYVKLQTRRVRLRSGEISSDLPPGQYLRIDIQDNGHGMNEEVQSRCFEPFFTTKGRDPESGVGVAGSGLGLSSVYSILRQHKGHVTVKSQENNGSTFSLFLPLLQSAPESEDVQRDEAISRRRSDVLIYSNDEVVTSAVRISLDAFGLVGHVSGSGSRLRDDLGARDAFQGILVVDLDDPELRVKRAGSAVRKASGNLRCLFVGKDPVPWSPFIRKFPHAEFVKKPLGAWSLHTAISRLLSLQGGSLSEEMEVTASEEEVKKRRKRKSQKGEKTARSAKQREHEGGKRS